VELSFADSQSLNDIRIFLQRVAAVGYGQALLVARDRVLAVFGCTSAPTSLLDPSPTVLGMRACEIVEPAQLNMLVEIRALADRFARSDGSSLSVPPTEVTAVWAGVQPPTSGWRRSGRIDAGSLREVAEQGSARVSELLPDQPGAAVVEQVRARVWNAEIIPGIPAGAAFAMDALGFLGRSSQIQLSEAPGWARLVSEDGQVLVRKVR
jgi:hypothetical protein